MIPFRINFESFQKLKINFVFLYIFLKLFLIKLFYRTTNFKNKEEVN